MSATRSDDFLREGAEMLRDLSGRERRVKGILRPRDKAEIGNTLRWAHQEKARLQPISCGKNWGFGSRLPQEKDAYLLDLSALNEIRQVDWNSDWAELEPGVTQGALDDQLAKHGRSHYFNVTGAGRQTSIIGNSLERGIGYFGSREEDILDLEVFLEDGSVFWTGVDRVNPFHTGFGPNLRGLFFQSNFGIVTAARYRLRKRPSCMGVVLAPLGAGQLIAQFVDGIVGMRREGLFCSVPHIGNRQRLLSTFGPVGSKNALNLSSVIPEWTCVIPISGPKTVVQSTLVEIAGRLGEFSACQLISPDLAPVEPRYANLIDLALGIPNDFALAGVANAALSETSESPLENDLDAGRAGLIHVTPTCAANGDEIDRLLAVIKWVRGNCDFGEIPMTLNLVNSGLVTAVISIPFDRQFPGSIGKARQLADQLLSACGSKGFLPYRVGLEDASLLQPQPAARSAILRKMHRLIDPELVLATSKYDAVWNRHAQGSPRLTSPRSNKKSERKMEVCA